MPTGDLVIKWSTGKWRTQGIIKYMAKEVITTSVSVINKREKLLQLARDIKDTSAIRETIGLREGRKLPLFTAFKTCIVGKTHK